MTGKDEERRFLSLLGLCRKAGRLIVGSDLACEAMGKRARVRLAVLSDGASENTKKRIRTKTAFYGISLLTVSLSPVVIGAAVGKGEIAVCAVTDENFSKELIRMELTGKETSQSEGGV